MAQSGYTPIQLYYSTTAAAVPVNTNLTSGELAINITDGKLYYKDNGGTVRLLASNATSAPVLSFQTSLSGLTPSTATSGVVTLAGTLGAASGGTGLTTLATGSLTYGAGTSPFSTLAIGTAGQILTVNSGATAPQWSTLSGVAVTTFSAGTTGFTPSSATAGAVTLAGTLATTNGGTNLTSFTSGGVVYASSTSALATGSALNFNGTSLAIGDTAASADGSSFYVYGNVPASTQLGIKIGGNANSYTQQAIRFYDTYFGAYAGYIGFTTNALTFGSGTTEGLRLTSTSLYTASGINVGIGTSSPAYKLDVNQAAVGFPGFRISGSNSPGMQIAETSGTVTSHFVNDSAGCYFGTTTSHPLVFRTVNTERMRLDSNGALSIATTSAINGEKLKVAGKVYINAAESDTQFTNGASLIFPGTYNNIRQSTNHDLQFDTYNAGTILTPLTIKQNGNVGIGTSSPAYKLDVAGYMRGVVSNASVGNASSMGLTQNGSGDAAISFLIGTTTEWLAGVDNSDSDSFKINNITGSGDFNGAGITLTTAGNLGLGVTPSAWSTGKGIEVGFAGSGIYSYSQTDTEFLSNAYYNAGYKFGGTGRAMMYAMGTAGSGIHSWHISSASGTAGTAISFTQAMTLDASGRLMVGTTSPSSGGNAKFTVTGNDVSFNINTDNRDTFLFTTGAANYGRLDIKADTTVAVRLNTNGDSYFTGGNLLVGTTSGVVGGERLSVDSGSQRGAVLKNSSSGNELLGCWNSATTGDNGFAIFWTEASPTQRGSISYNRTGGLTVYATTSDYRAKDIIGPVTNSGALIDSIPVYMGKMKWAEQERPMFIAHETPSYAHTGVKDAVDADGNPVYQQMDASALIPVMWAEIQSLRQRVAQLETN